MNNGTDSKYTSLGIEALRYWVSTIQGLDVDSIVFYQLQKIFTVWRSIFSPFTMKVEPRPDKNRISMPQIALSKTRPVNWRSLVIGLVSDTHVNIFCLLRPFDSVSVTIAFHQRMSVYVGQAAEFNGNGLPRLLAGGWDNSPVGNPYESWCSNRAFLDINREVYTNGRFIAWPAVCCRVWPAKEVLGNREVPSGRYCGAQ